MTATTSFTPHPTLRLGDWATLGAEATTLRMAVFVQEQGIPAELEVDEMDALALHAVAYGPHGQAVATGRLLPAEAGQARVGRMAVARTLRGQGWGRVVLDALVQAARARGDREVLLHAQSSAAAFYRRAGFVAQGEPFDEVGIVHITMVLGL